MTMKTILFSLFGYDNLTHSINKKLNYEIGRLILHQFPDEEIMIKIEHEVDGDEVIFITSLDRPNSKLIPLVFAAETAKKLGAKKVTLIATYLPYMRQDKKFHEGEGISAQYFAKLISSYFDRLITIDPHLHRIISLDEIYSIPSVLLHATENIADWIKKNVDDPILIGPDIESSQWVSNIATKANSPFIILEKERSGDTAVKVSVSNIEKFRHFTPVLIDDIISTAMTMIETVKHLHYLQMKPPICIGVHAVFADEAYQNLLDAGVSKVITCNTILHSSNAIDISNIIAKAFLQ